MKTTRAMQTGRVLIAILTAQLSALAAPELPMHAPPRLVLSDQFERPQALTFPGTNLVVLTIADQDGSQQVDAWIGAIKSRYAGRLDVRGLAQVGGVPGIFRERIRRKFRQARSYPVMLDWSGTNCAAFGYEPGRANLLVLDRMGAIRGRVSGPASPANVEKLVTVLESLLERLPASAARPASPR